MSRRIAASGRDVPYLTERALEDEASLLLAEYGREHAEIMAPPVPIDEIIEIHLKLTFELKDLADLFGHGDVHGALWINKKLVGVDQSLDPTVYPSKLGRFRFTLAHETGHWRLHRQYYIQNPDQKTLFAENDTKPAYICRSAEAKKPVEWQADYFAASLLMPRKLVCTAWEASYGELKPIALQDLRAKQHEIVTSDALRRAGPRSGGDISDDLLMECYSRPLAADFQVSPEAMRIRLEQLKLLVRRREASLFD